MIAFLLEYPFPNFVLFTIEHNRLQLQSSFNKLLKLFTILRIIGEFIAENFSIAISEITNAG